MTTHSFYKALSAVTAATGALLGLLHFVFPPVQEHWALSLSVLVIFFLLSLLLFFAGVNATRSNNRNAFTAIISGSVFGKMILALAVLFIYRQTCQPTNQWFAGIFLLVYAIYTIFEVWFMTRIAQNKKN